MGMAASQARLLSITARLTNNENSGQSISYSKQRLADQTQQITNEYNEALDATKLTVLTGFNGAIANYEDISYNTMTSLNMAESTKQYVVTDTKGRILVTEELADAFAKSKGNYNLFLSRLGYSQADIKVQKTYADSSQKSESQAETEQKIHEAWDKYFKSVGITKYMPEHDFGFSWVETSDLDDGSFNIGDGYAAYVVDGKFEPINYEGTTEESKDLYDYAMALTEAYLRVNVDGTSDTGVAFHEQFDLGAYKSAADADNNSALKYYKNIFNKMKSSGYFTYTDTPSKANDHYIYSETTKGTSKVAKNPLKDNYTFEGALRDGTLRLEYYSTSEKIFKSTNISDDTCIQEVRDERAIAKAESKYNQDMAALESQDKKLDLELKKLDTEHNALQTEYDSVKSVVDKNVEASFKIFS